MDTIFRLTATALHELANLLSTTYYVANILIYIILLPIAFLTVICYLRHNYIYLIGYCCFLFAAFCPFSQERIENVSMVLFAICVLFLQSFELVGMNYVVASVVICILVPIGFIIYLVYRLCKKVRLKTNSN